MICEYVTEEFKPMNEKRIFYSTDFSIQVLVQMKEIQTDRNILFHWYKEGSQDVLIGTYEIPIKGKETYPRFALAGMEIPLLFLEENNNSVQKWYVLIETYGICERKEFEIRSHNLYNGKSNSNLQIPVQSGRQWDA